MNSENNSAPASFKRVNISIDSELHAVAAAYAPEVSHDFSSLVSALVQRELRDQTLASKTGVKIHIEIPKAKKKAGKLRGKISDEWTRGLSGTGT